MHSSAIQKADVMVLHSSAVTAHEKPQAPAELLVMPQPQKTHQVEGVFTGPDFDVFEEKYHLSVFA